MDVVCFLKSFAKFSAYWAVNISAMNALANGVKGASCSWRCCSSIISEVQLRDMLCMACRMVISLW